MPKEYIIYADESIGRGQFNSNFYSGLLVTSDDIEPITRRLQREKEKHSLFNKVKWSKVTANYLEKYMAMIDAFFKHIKN